VDIGDDDKLLFTIMYFLADRRYPTRPKYFTTPFLKIVKGVIIEQSCYLEINMRSIPTFDVVLPGKNNFWPWSLDHGNLTKQK